MDRISLRPAIARKQKPEKMMPKRKTDFQKLIEALGDTKFVLLIEGENGEIAFHGAVRFPQNAEIAAIELAEKKSIKSVAIYNGRIYTPEKIAKLREEEKERIKK